MPRATLLRRFGSLSLSILCIVLFFLWLIAAGPARAGDYIVTLGGAVGMAPAYEGSDRLVVTGAPKFTIRRAGTEAPFFMQSDSPGLAMWSTDYFSAGPIVALSLGRDASRGSDRLDGLSDVDPTLEAGGYLEWWVADRVRARTEIKSGVFGGHSGTTGSVSLTWVERDVAGIAGLTIAAGPRIDWADSAYGDAFYGVDAGTAARTGLAIFDTRSGAKSFGAEALVLWPWSRSVTLFSYARYDRIASDFADSPIVAHGARDQILFGAGAMTTFDLALPF